MEILKCDGIRKVYGEKNNQVIALNGIDLSISKGEFVALVGASGSGKSTLLHILGSVDKPTSGKVVIDGTELSTLNRTQASLGLSERLEALPNQLSGGQQQRAAIARSLIYRPALLLADEPTGNLDQKNSREVIDMLRLSNRNLEQTILLITHDEKVALEAERIITMEDGRIVSDERKGAKALS